VALMEALAVTGDLDGDHLLPAACAGSYTEAAQSCERALVLVTNESEPRFPERRGASQT
jgi:hypothetical protein